MDEDRVIDLQRWRDTTERAPPCDSGMHNVDNISKIIEWSVEMRVRGLMPDEVAEAFAEHFG
jgi:hypothetical protein